VAASADSRSSTATIRSRRSRKSAAYAGILVVDCAACAFQHHRLRAGGQAPDSIEQRLQDRPLRACAGTSRHGLGAPLSGESAVAALRSLTGVVECRQIGLDGDPALFYLVFKGLLAKRQHSAAAQGPQQARS